MGSQRYWQGLDLRCYQWSRCLLIFVLLVLPLSATSYYVDNCVTVGSDSNNGTSTGTPWLTIEHVNAHSLNPGDSVLFQSTCEWREALTVPSSGNYTSAITIGAYGTGVKPIITGSDIITGWTLDSGNIWESPLATQPKIVFFNGALGIPEPSVAAITAANEWYWASNLLHVYSTRNPGTAYISPGIEAGKRRYAIDTNSQSYLNIQGLDLRGSNGWYSIPGYGGGGLVVDGSSNVTAQALHTHLNTLTGILVTAGATPPITILNNESDHNNSGINFFQYMGTSGSPTLVSGNNIHDNGYSPPGGVEPFSNGILLYSNYVTAERNSITNTGSTTMDAIGLHFDNSNGQSYGANNIGRWNTISGTVATALLDGSGIETDNYTGPNQIYGNIIYGNDAQCIDIYASIGTVAVNNTCYGNANGSPYFTAEISVTDISNLTGATPNNVVSNNAVYATKASGYAIYVDSHESAKTNTYANNLLYDTGQANWYFWSDTGGSNLAAFNALPGAALNLTGDPQFANASAVQFWLASGSPAISAGANLGTTYQWGVAPSSSWPASVSTLKHNTYGSGWEIGAFVFVPQISPAPPTSLSVTVR